MSLALERSQNVKEVGVITLPLGRDAIVLKALPRVVLGIEAGTPAFVAKGRIGDDEPLGTRGVRLFSLSGWNLRLGSAAVRARPGGLRALPVDFRYCTETLQGGRRDCNA
jgi:hypothetical protein